MNKEQAQRKLKLLIIKILVTCAIEFVLLLGMFYILISLPRWLENWVGAILIILGGLAIIDKPVNYLYDAIVRKNKW